jgi:tetratricopeptide (TPR) repeat protein
MPPVQERTSNRIFLLPLFLLLGAAPPPPSTAEADTAALRGDWSGASKAYAAALSAGSESADLEYDLGTAAAQAGEVGEATLHLERALKLSPWDGDARANLERLRERRIDKVAARELGEGPLERLLAGLPVAGLSWAFVFSWSMGFAMLALAVLGRLDRRKGSFGAALIAIGLACGALWLAGSHQRSVPYAVVVAKSASVRTGPASDLPASFEVHEGLKVIVQAQAGDYYRVRLANGLEGYLKSEEIERI